MPERRLHHELSYTNAGDRKVATYATPQGAVKWSYFDYMSLGMDGSRPFRTLALLNRDESRKKEEFKHAPTQGTGRHAIGGELTCWRDRCSNPRPLLLIKLGEAITAGSGS